MTARVIPFTPRPPRPAIPVDLAPIWWERERVEYGAEPRRLPWIVGALVWAWTLMRAARRLRAVGHLVEEMRAKVRERRGR